MIVQNLNFEWDNKKNRNNQKKHGISFETAVHIFADPFLLEQFYGIHSENEDRYKVIGSIDGYLYIIVVVYTMRHENKVIRIISARPACRLEKEEYYGHR
ncbi:MAG: BrnT family toxin [Butyrivibrio sp.]|nr:BrnT family toxin [Butyrivibrio sp.]